MPAICSTEKNLFMTTFMIGLFGGNQPESDEIDAKDCSGVNTLCLQSMEQQGKAYKQRRHR